MCRFMSKGSGNDKIMASPIIGERIRYARKKIGYSQEILAEKIDCTVATISSYETGRTTPDIDMIIALATALDVTVYWLIGMEEGMNSILYAIVTALKLYNSEQQRAILSIVFTISRYFKL